MFSEIEKRSVVFLVFMKNLQKNFATQRVNLECDERFLATVYMVFELWWI